ncbi:lytic transglycosylase catalytic [Photorhabdus sp. SF281]|uniref:lytic transglycosylase catalytic n=1 Tax=Photorhabdus sp. SF281 TaxID=3459527 RepID=UPI0040439818
MSNDTETIEDFLGSLRFDVDEVGQRKFMAVITEVMANVLKMRAEIENAAFAVVNFTTQIADGLNKLYWQSQKTGATAEKIKAIGYAVSQAGGSIEGFNQSLEGVANSLHKNPDSEGLLQNIGVRTRDANGNLRDTASLVVQAGEQLSKMPLDRANQYASRLGIDENTLMAMRRGIGEYVSEYQGMMKTIGYNPTRAAQQSNQFMTHMNSLNSLFGMMKEKIGADLAGELIKNIESFQQTILLNFPEIEKVITRVLHVILNLADGITLLVSRVGEAISDLIDGWDRLDGSTKTVVKSLGGLLLAWKLLNMAFMTSPIGMITSLAAALLLLYEDYKVWKQGGKHFIDWDKWKPYIDEFLKAIEKIAGWINEGAKAVGGWENVLKGFAAFVAVSWAAKMIKGISSVTNAVLSLAKASKSVTASGILGKAGVAGVVAVASEPYIDKALNRAFGGYNYFQRIRTAKTWDDFGSALIGEGNAYWDEKGNWVDKRGESTTPKGYSLFAADIPGDAPVVANKSDKTTAGRQNNNPNNINVRHQMAVILESHPKMGVDKNEFIHFGAAMIGPPPNKPSKLAGHLNNVAHSLKNISIDPRMIRGAVTNINSMMNHQILTPHLLLHAPIPTGNNVMGIGEVNYHIEVNGVESPREAARLTGETVERTHSMLLRNMQTQVR